MISETFVYSKEVVVVIRFENNGVEKIKFNLLNRNVATDHNQQTKTYSKSPPKLFL